MLTVTYQHHGYGYGGDVDPAETIELPITISESEVTIHRSDCCETIIQPPITDNDLRVLRWALNELTDEEWLGLEEEVLA